MKKLLVVTTLAALLMPAAALAQSVFNGTWKIDTNHVNFPDKPEIILLQDGMYSCKTCDPPFTVKADGSDQKISGDPYADTIAIKVANDHEFTATVKKNGKVVNTSTTTILPDGNTEEFEFSVSSNPPVTGKGKQVRVAAGPPGSSPISGSWRQTKIEFTSDDAGAFTYKVNGNELTMKSIGQAFTAEFNGAEAPMKGDPGVTSVRLKLIDKYTLEETDLRNGKIVQVWTMTVAPDGKTANARSYDPHQNTTATFRVVKQ